MTVIRLYASLFVQFFVFGNQSSSPLSWVILYRVELRKGSPGMDRKISTGNKTPLIQQ